MKNLAHIYELLVQEQLLVEVRGGAEPSPVLVQDQAQPSAPSNQTLVDWLSTIPVSGADCDSRVVEPYHIFFCKGKTFTPVYLIKALQAGACAWIAEASLVPSLEAELQAHRAGDEPLPPGFVVSDIRRAMAFVSAEAWGHPNNDLLCFGITGTKGKTTTATFLRALLEAAGYPSAFMGTHEVFDGQATFETATTTPEAPDLWRYLAHAREAGLKACVMEVSSQALKYDRTLGLTFDVAGFLNIGNDHISPIEHPSFEDYLASKLRIFKQTKHAVINRAMDHAQEVIEAAEGLPVALYECELPQSGSHEPNEQLDSHDHHVDTAATTASDLPLYRATDVVSSVRNTRFITHTPQGKIDVTLAMNGLFNAENALAAMAMAGTVGIDLKAAVPALAQCQVSGRMELFCSPDERLVCLVDYAHNDSSYLRFFETVKSSWPHAYVISVFGVSGGKALDRYVDLPRIASAESNYVVLTSDDPGFEDPQELVDRIATSVEPGTPYLKEPNREKAVEFSFSLALKHWQAGELVVLCLLGKGREDALYVGSGGIPIENDAIHIQRLLREEGLLATSD